MNGKNVNIVRFELKISLVLHSMYLHRIYCTHDYFLNLHFLAFFVNLSAWRFNSYIKKYILRIKLTLLAKNLVTFQKDLQVNCYFWAPLMTFCGSRLSWGAERHLYLLICVINLSKLLKNAWEPHKTSFHLLVLTTKRIEPNPL